MPIEDVVRKDGQSRYEASGLRPTIERLFYREHVGQSRRDKEWPTPRTTRHVWIRQPGLQVPPVQGYVIAWRRHSYRWAGLTVYVADGKVIQEWLPLERLSPVKARAIDMPGNH